MKINGKAIVSKILEDLKNKVQKLNITPHLAIILIGNDPASSAYVKQKKLKANFIKAKTAIKYLSSDTSNSSLLETIQQFNNNSNIHGIIVQKPLPSQINLKEITLAINPKKDVDGFHPNSKFQSPIALAVLRIISLVRSHLVASQGETLANWLKSKKILVIGKGETGGKPIIDMFRKMNIQPEIIDSKTKNPSSVTKTADIIISAVGKPNVIKPEMIKKNSILISIGLSKGKDGKLHGDYDEEKIKDIASFYTPTPGGIGPVNVAMLLANLITAVEKRLN